MRGVSSSVAKVDVVVALNEVIATATATATSASSPLSVSCNRGIDGIVVH